MQRFLDEPAQLMYTPFFLSPGFSDGYLMPFLGMGVVCILVLERGYYSSVLWGAINCLLLEV